MPDRTAIEWTDATWNPVTGCTKVSPGCAHCYAETITLRFKRGGPFLPGKTTIVLHPDRLHAPSKWKKPKRIFVNSMSDVFHEEVPFDFVSQIFDVMRDNPRHTFQVLTKRPEHMFKYLESPEFKDWPDNVWIGVSVENQYWAERRIPLLQEMPARIRFLSVEPLLKKVDLKPHLDGIHWVIVGGESGPKARPIDPSWVKQIRDDCVEADVAFFFKQWGGRHSKARGRILDGEIWNRIPTLA